MQPQQSLPVSEWGCCPLSKLKRWWGMDWEKKNDKTMIIRMLKKKKASLENELECVNKELKKHRVHMWWNKKQNERV